MKKISLWLVNFGIFLLSLMLPCSISGIAISVSMIFLGYILFCISEGEIVISSRKENKIIVFLMIIFLVVMLCSTCFSLDISSSIKRSVTVGGYFFIFLSIFLVNDRQFLIKSFYIFLLLCVLHSIYAIFQFFTGVDIMGKGYQPYNRVIGIVGHFNSLAGILGLVVPVVFCLSYFVKENRILHIFSLLTIFFATVLTFTRGVWLGVFLSFIVIGLLSEKKIFTFSIIFILILFSIPVTKKRIVNTFVIEETARKKFLELTPKMFLEQPQRIVLGFGPDSFRKVFYQKYPDFIEKGHFHPHNMYLHLFFEIGLVGIAIFLAMFYFIIKRLIKLYYNTTENFGKTFVLGTIGSVVVFLIYGLVDEPFRAHFAPYVLFFLFSLSDRYGELVQK